METRITSRLRDLLGTAKNANEMFRYFSRFNALFVRPHIRGAIREYQTQLIQRVKDDIEALHAKFKIQYLSSNAYHMTKLRDVPPVAGSIIWARQIERQLNAYLRRVEDVLGGLNLDKLSALIIFDYRPITESYNTVWSLYLPIVKILN